MTRRRLRGCVELSGRFEKGGPVSSGVRPPEKALCQLRRMIADVLSAPRKRVDSFPEQQGRDHHIPARKRYSVKVDPPVQPVSAAARSRGVKQRVGWLIVQTVTEGDAP